MSTNKNFPRLFSPIEIRGRSLRNRIVFGAHTTNMSEQGLPGERHLAYYRERAMGGAAMLVIEPMPVHPAAVLTRGNFRHGSDEVIPHFRKITEAVQEEGALILQQLYHVGQHGDSDNSYHANWSPSGLPSYHDSDGSHAMNDAEIEETIECFVQAARRCRDAGFDGVEVWAAYHGIVDQFWTPWSNRRKDRWGGSLENRTRFSREIITRIRKLCGDDFIVGISVNDEPDFEVALQRESIAEIIAYHERDNLIDYVSCGTGSYFDFYKLMPTFLYPERLGADLAEVLKSAVSHALVIAESHVRTPENAEAVLSAEQADLVSIVRGQIADPHLSNKAREGRADQSPDRRVAVLGLMAELGDRAADEHLAIAQRVADLGLELVAVGTDLYGVESLADLDAAYGALDLAVDDAVLVKGSRVAGLEVLAARLLDG